MARELKFRAWDKENKQWLDMGLIAMCQSDLGGITLYNIETSGFGSNYLQKNVEVMQYTGLKDKNGKEIYEGDIVKTGVSGNERGIIEFHECRFVARLPDEKPANPEFPVFFAISRYYPIEVIGNIFENPELIK